ncbi:uncharacterized protein LOC134033924 [Osmerus eperlanus]|uniref:uncharacterized protein LOC134033924 n=1 Tax=Osmerus eperlanus TaxID=29151 RepID=UPI002E0DA1D6
MKTPDTAFLSALIPTLLILIHVATAATDHPSQNTTLMTQANSTSTETTTKAVKSSNAESSRNSTTEAPPPQGNSSSTTPSADNVTLSTSASSSLLPVQPTTQGSAAFPVTQAKTPAIPSSTSSSVSPATQAGSAGALDGGSITIVLLVVIVLLILILVAAFKWASRPSNQNSPASRMILGFGERVRGEVRTLEDRLGFRLWPGEPSEQNPYYLK